MFNKASGYLAESVLPGLTTMHKPGYVNIGGAGPAATVWGTSMAAGTGYGAISDKKTKLEGLNIGMQVAGAAGMAGVLANKDARNNFFSKAAFGPVKGGALVGIAGGTMLGSVLPSSGDRESARNTIVWGVAAGVAGAAIGKFSKPLSKIASTFNKG